MSDPDLEALAEILRAGVRDLREAADKLHPGTDHDAAFGSTVATFNNGLLKGYWKIFVTADEPDEWAKEALQAWARVRASGCMNLSPHGPHEGCDGLRAIHVE